MAVFSENRARVGFRRLRVWARKPSLVPVDYMSTAEELAYVLDDCQPGALFCSAQTRPVASGRSRSPATARSCFDRSRPRPARRGPTGADPIVVDEEALAAIVYTSGTTGNPRA